MNFRENSNEQALEKPSPDPSHRTPVKVETAEGSGAGAQTSRLFIPDLVWLSPKAKRFISNHFTAREQDCIRFLFLGATAKDIALKLQLSPRTIEYYLENIKTKLSCSKKSLIISTILSKTE